MKLLLVRHAESNGNAAGGDYSVADADALSTRGHAQAEALASCLEHWSIDMVIASPARRALQTIAPYLAAAGRIAEVWPELTEACWQEERMPIADTWNSQPAALPRDIAQHFYFRDGNAIRPGNPATFGTDLRRVHDALERIEKSFGKTEQTILIASHRFFIGELVALMLKLRNRGEFHNDNCSMTLMLLNGKWQMEFCNRAPHPTVSQVAP